MNAQASYNIAVLAGDGIGPEVTAPTVALLNIAAAAAGGLALNFIHLEAGAARFKRPEYRYQKKRWTLRAKPTRYYSVQWACRALGIPTALRLRHSLNCARNSISMPAYGLFAPSKDCQRRSQTRVRRTSILLSSESQLRAYSSHATVVRSSMTQLRETQWRSLAPPASGFLTLPLN